ncbi:MAG TPA: lysyl oxidase family protein [Steroidobacteraceae bacterium]|nr:lysyl oxidase family protein [Steroidobacteraceae bacterium]
MVDSTRRGLAMDLHPLAYAALAIALLCARTATAACPAGQTELLPNIRALPATSIAMLDATNMRFSATSWNSGDAKLELVARNPETDPATGQTKQPVDQRVYCSGGGFYDRAAGKAEYHAEHNHVHYNDYANYILEPADASNPQNPRQGSKTTFCIMDTTGVNTQLRSASASPVFNWCPTQDPSFNTQGMSVGWGDTYGANLPGQSLPIGDLAPGVYRLRHVFDPKNLLLEKDDSDNESCKLVEIGDGANGRYVADRGLCNPPPQPTITSIAPRSAQHGTCVNVTITGTNLEPELQVSLSGGTGPLPGVKTTAFDVAGTYLTATICVPKAKGNTKTPKLGSDPVWDITLAGTYAGTAPVVRTNLFTVTP